MSRPPHPEQPVQPLEPTESSAPGTSEIPVVRPGGTATRSLPPHPGATAAGAARPATPTEGPQPTGPVEFVPGLPGTPPPPPPVTPQPAPATPPQATPPPPPPATATAVWPESLEADDPASGAGEERAPRDRRALVRIGLAALTLVLLQLGLALEVGGGSLWAAVPLWSAFATLAAVVPLLALVLAAAPGGRIGEEAAWRVGAACLVGLSVFWLLVVLPGANTDRGFLLTAAVACLGGALWVGTARKG